MRACALMRAGVAALVLLPGLAWATSCVGLPPVMVWPVGPGQPRDVHPVVLGLPRGVDSVVLEEVGPADIEHKKPVTSSDLYFWGGAYRLKFTFGSQLGPRVPADTVPSERMSGFLEVRPKFTLPAGRQYAVMGLGAQGEVLLGRFETTNRVADDRPGLDIEQLSSETARFADIFGWRAAIVRTPRDPPDPTLTASRLVLLWLGVAAEGPARSYILSGTGLFRFGEIGGCSPSVPMPEPGKWGSYVVREWRRDGTLGPAVVLNVQGPPP